MANHKTVVGRNINHPSNSSHLDARMHQAMRHAYLEVLPRSAPGLTLAEIGERLLPLLPQELYPNGAKAGWWAKTVQLYLEAKGVIERERVRPLRLHRGRAAG
jgi:hypothetical protein